MNPVATSDAAFRGGACPTPEYTIAYTGNYTTSADANWVPDELITSAIAVSNELYTLLGQRKLLTGVACFRVIEE
jgi:hypothetical protein